MRQSVPVIFPSMFVIFVVISLLAGCGGNAATPNAPTTPTANTPTTPPAPTTPTTPPTTTPPTTTPPSSGGSGTPGSGTGGTGSSGSPATAYTIQEVTGAPGIGVSMNSNAQITGTGGMHAWMWSNGQVTDLGTLGGNGSYGQAINDSAQVAGVSQTSTTGSDHAFLYSNGAMTDLGTLGGHYSIAYGMNNAGQVVGYSETSSNPPLVHAFVYSNGKMQDLAPNSPAGQPSEARAINDSGVVVGDISPTGANGQATMWVNGVAQPLITDTAHQSIAFAISNTGYVTGMMGISGSNASHAFRWSNGTLIDLGTLPNRDTSQGMSVNDAGVVVGGSYIYGRPPQTEAAFIYQNGQMQDLNSLIPANSGWVLAQAIAINSKGQILVRGTHNGQVASAILNPTH